MNASGIQTLYKRTTTICDRIALIKQHRIYAWGRWAAWTRSSALNTILHSVTSENHSPTMFHTATIRPKPEIQSHPLRPLELHLWHYFGITFKDGAVFA